MVFPPQLCKTHDIITFFLWIIVNQFYVLLILIASMLTPRTASAKDCQVGKPCGNTCIARTDTCHVGSSDNDNVPPTPTVYHAFNTMLFSGATISLLASVLSTSEDRKIFAWLGLVGHGIGLPLSHLRVPEIERKHGVDLSDARTVYFALNLVGVVFDILVIADVINTEPSSDLSFDMSPTSDMAGAQLKTTFSF